MKIYHIGLCAGRSELSSVSQSFVNHSDYYIETGTGDPDLNRTITEICKDKKPDLVFMQIQAPNIVSVEAVREMKKHAGKIVNWTGDVREPLPQWYIDMGRVVDWSTFSCQKDVETMKSHGLPAAFIQIGFDPNIYRPDYNVSKDIDIIYNANHYGDTAFPLSRYRRETAEMLKSHYGKRFHLYGTGWNIADGNCNHSQYDEAKLYQRSKVALNISHFDTYTSDRLLRILGTGVACVSHRFGGCEDYPLTYYSDHTNLIAHIDELLNDEKLRKQKALQGYKYAIENLTFDNMVKNIIDLCK